MFSTVMMKVLMAAALTFIISVIIGPVVIPVLRRLKFGQEIREIGPSWHKSKSGTPTMGGVIFIAAAIIASAVFIRDAKVWAVMILALSFGIIGFIDDFIKVVMKRNLGLTEKQKFLLQLLASVVFVFVCLHFNLISTKIIIPFVKTSLDLKWIYIPFAIFVLVGTTNSVNLTDGLDGLASSVTVVVSVFFTIAAVFYGQTDTAVFSAVVTGGCLGFLIFNAYPAKVFMGDTGSLFLGGAIVGISLVLEMPLVLVIAGGVYVLETLSVIIQVTSYKLTKKRVFKMSPLHHHFEMCGWKERKIVFAAIVLSVILCILAYIAI